MTTPTKFTAVVLTLSALYLSASEAAQASDTTPPTVHLISGDEAEVHANAYIIEGRDGLVLVDSLLTVTGGERVHARIRELEKPLEAVVLTHGHPDHYGGLSPAVGGLEVPIYAVRGVDDVIRRDDAGKGEALAAFGIPWPDRRTFPTDIVTDGETLTFRDISLTAHEIGPAESDFDSVWLLDAGDASAVFAGDLMTIDEHVYVADGNTANWIGAVRWLQRFLPENALVYPGHGEVLTAEDFSWVIGYLEHYREEISRLAEGGVRLTHAEKKDLRGAMINYVGNDRNARWTEEGADAVAQELANERWRKKWTGDRAMNESFEFTYDGARIVGRLYLPDGDPVAALVTTGPLTSVKEQASGAYAKALAERGFAVLAFDHRGFGESEGMPRQFENPEAKAEDIRAAAAALRADPRTRELPLAAVGVCAGAGYMARAVAAEPAFVAFAGVAGYYAEATPDSIAAAQEAIERGRAAERRWRDTGVAEMIPAVAADGGDVAMPLREAYEFYGTPRGAVPNYVNQYAVQSFAYSIPFDAVGAAADITVPTLVVHSENALAPPLARKFIAGLNGPHQDLWLESEGQIDFYDDPKLIAPAADAIAAFFRDVLVE